MARTGARVTMGVVGVLAVVCGTTGVVVGALVGVSMTGTDAWRSAAQVIDVPGCSTAVMEIAEAHVDAPQLEPVRAIAPLRDRTQARLIVTAQGTGEQPWLIGVADQRAIESRLLGARYCLVEARAGSWTSTPVEVAAGAPDVRIDGIAGEWAISQSGRPVALPVPTFGSSVVVSGSDNSSLSTMSIAGEVIVEGGSDAGLISLLGGTVTFVLGVILLVVSIHTLRNHGEHERARRSDSGIPT